jgi:hypothetical protein
MVQVEEQPGSPNISSLLERLSRELEIKRANEERAKCPGEIFAQIQQSQQQLRN